MTKRFIIAAVLLVVVCGGLIGFNLFRAKMIGDFFANRQMPSVAVSATEVQPRSWTPEIEAIGSLVATHGVDVAVEVAGVVKTIEFAANEQVEEGQLLVQIDDAIERADLISAEAAVERDRAQAERVRTLRRNNVSSEATLETATSALAESESALARIRAVLEQKAVEAPFAGEIGIPRVDVGEYIQPGSVIATLQQLTRMKADFTVPEQLLPDLAIGQAGTFGLDGDTFDHTGEITGIDPKVDPQTRLVAVQAVVENPDGTLRPGQFVRIRLQLPEVAEVIALPQTSVVASLYGSYVYVVEPAAPAEGAAPAAESGEVAAAGEVAAPQLVARQVFVKTGRRQGNLIEIAEGGQQVVTGGQNKLATGMPVTIDNEIDPAALSQAPELRS
jgi:membrane fusion protein (multidrug efflux system)